ncbi:HypC/HybG/HupF family hydrogenase formation chaperone [soil metagenome]
MCLGIPALVLRDHDDHPDLVVADVAGAPRGINVGLLDPRPAPGDWVVVHMGFALEPMTAAQAREAVAVLTADGPQLQAMLDGRPDGWDRPG